MRNKLILKSLTLNNFATFDNQVIEFNDSFNTIVGETGSGKSLILDALQLVFGMRADKKIIRKGSIFSTVEAVFSCGDKEIQDYFLEIGHPFEEDEIIVKRIINQEGSSKAYLNFQQCSLSTLSSISKRYVDLVGQFDNQKLLSEDYQLKLVDDYSSNNSKTYIGLYTKLKERQNELEELTEISKTLLQRKDYLDFQINELEGLDPTEEDELFLIAKKDELLSEIKKAQSYKEASDILSENNHSITSLLKGVISKVERNDLLPESEYSSLIEAVETIEEISYFISKKNQDITDEDELQEIIERLDAYQKVKRKFNCSTKELEDIFRGFKDEFDRIETSDTRIKHVKDEIRSLQEQCWNEASKLHQARVSASKKLSSDLTKKVRSLRMTGATIKIECSEQKVLSSNGCTSISFIAQTNSGEGYFRIKDIASGGELSRILLSLRQILSQSDTISVFLFDEIDTGIGGETAVTIGKALKEVSQASQVIAITHLPQIAKFSDLLIDVDKKEISKRTYSFTKVIDATQRESYLQNMAQI
ncbi:DNA repair protein RecN [Halobacteriovorax sp. HLS]|uniref:DNA repair protein RecN n=1 Tax=Halobacteriovorax sp. HLS TaxID=2234000 RepID=UPI000FDB11F1|nr:AAA family ATPase [Halobacteriovorax sp. HLS]